MSAPIGIRIAADRSERLDDDPALFGVLRAQQALRRDIAPWVQAASLDLMRRQRPVEDPIRTERAAQARRERDPAGSPRYPSGR